MSSNESENTEVPPQPAPTKNKGGRPKKEIDEKVVFQLASLMATQEDIAANQDCSVDTLHERFPDLLKRGNQIAKLSLRAKQYQLAMGRDGQPAEYLRMNQTDDGKQYGDLVLDKRGNPIKIKSEVKALAPNCTMLIWLGKQHLNQSDKFQVADGDGFEFVP